MLKYYIATSLTRAKHHNSIRDALNPDKFQLTYDWTKHGNIKSTSQDRLNTVAMNESRGILQADIVIVLLPGGFGTHVEIGLGIAANKTVIIHSEDKEVFLPCEKTCAFYHHDQVYQVNSPLQLLPARVENLIQSLDTLCLLNG